MEETNMFEKMRAITLIAATMAAGYVGGLMSHMGTPAVADGNVPVTSDLVRARKFVLVDVTGATRGVFSTVDGEPCLELRDSKSKTRGVFRMIADEPCLDLFDSMGKTRGVLSTFHGEPYLGLFGSSGKPVWKAP
jgi:hypothetical protein